MTTRKKRKPAFRSVPYSSRAMNEREDEERTSRESARIIEALNPADRELYRPSHPITPQSWRS